MPTRRRAYREHLRVHRFGQGESIEASSRRIHRRLEEARRGNTKKKKKKKRKKKHQKLNRLRCHGAAFFSKESRFGMPRVDAFIGLDPGGRARGRDHRPGGWRRPRRCMTRMGAAHLVTQPSISQWDTPRFSACTPSHTASRRSPRMAVTVLVLLIPQMRRAKHRSRTIESVVRRGARSSGGRKEINLITRTRPISA